MPDREKLDALTAAKFRIDPACGNCTSFRTGQVSPWGWCSKIAPTHSKHTDGARVTVRSEGSCPQHTWSPDAIRAYDTAGLDRFLPETVRMARLGGRIIS